MDYFQDIYNNLGDIIISQLESFRTFTRTFYDVFATHLSPFNLFIRPYTLPNDPAVIPRLTKRFSSFLRKAVSIIPKVLTESRDMSRQSAFELLYIFHMCVDCLELIASEFDSNPYVALNHRYEYMRCLRHWELHDEAYSQLLVALESFNRIVKTQSSPKLRVAAIEDYHEMTVGGELKEEFHNKEEHKLANEEIREKPEQFEVTEEECCSRDNIMEPSLEVDGVEENPPVVTNEEVDKEHQSDTLLEEDQIDDGEEIQGMMTAVEDLVLRLDLLQKLDNHRGCVNTVSFNEAGDILVSGSDDKRIILWDWETGHIKQSFHSGHHNNVFQAEFMPFTDDRSIVTWVADGQVRRAQLLECGKVDTKLLARHKGRAHKLSVEPVSPYVFYTCGEDGLVQHIDLRSGTTTHLFTCKPLVNEVYMSTVHLNTIAIDPRNPNFFPIGGSDQFACLYDIRKYNWDASSELDRPVDFFYPPNLIDNEHVVITGLAFSDKRELLVSYNDEFIYLFTKDSGLGPNPIITAKVSDESDTYGPDTCSTLSNSDAKIDYAPQAYKCHKNCETDDDVHFSKPKFSGNLFQRYIMQWNYEDWVWRRYKMFF